MENIFKIPSNTEMSYNKDIFQNRSNLLDNYKGYLFPTDQPLNQVELKPLGYLGQHSKESPKFSLNIYEPNSRSFLETNQNHFSPNSRFQYNFQSEFERMKAVPSRPEEDGALNIPDEKKSIINLTYSAVEEWSPYEKLQRSQNRSQSPIVRESKGNISARPALKRSKTPTVAKKKKQAEDLNISRDGSVSRKINRYGSSERFYEGKTERILKTDKSFEAGKSTLSKQLGGISPIQKNKSGLLDTSTHSACYSPLKKNNKIDKLRDLKIGGASNSEAKARTGFGAVRETLDDVLNERDQMKAIVEKLKQAMREEKAAFDKAEENIRFLANHSQCLSKRSEHLDKNTVNTQTITNKMREEVQQLQEEVKFCNNVLVGINKQIDIETALIKINQKNSKLLKTQLLNETKRRDNIKEKVEVSRHDKKKAMEKYQNAVNSQKNIINTLENQFQRFAS